MEPVNQPSHYTYWATPMPLPVIYNSQTVQACMNLTLKLQNKGAPVIANLDLVVSKKKDEDGNS